MPRRKYKKITVKNDLLYDSIEVARLINYIMFDGKKTTAQKIVYSSLDEMKKQNLDPVEVLHRAIQNVGPIYEVKPKRVGGASYLVPTETSSTRKIFLALRWIIEGARGRSNREYKSFDKKLFAELMDAYKGEGKAAEKKRQVEKLAEANKAFAHFRW